MSPAPPATLPRAPTPLLIGSTAAPLRPGVKNILVTGGAGFIGSWVVRHLVVHHPEYHVVCFDRIDCCATLKNLETVQHAANYSYCYGDITDLQSVVHALRKHSIDTILHFAAQSHVDLSFGNSFAFTLTNVYGTHTLLEAAKAHGIGLFVHVSTDEVYGEVPSDAADLLETSILAPTNPYAASKAAAEMQVNAYYKSFKLPVIIVRSNNVFGPLQYPEKLIPKFCCLLNRRQKLLIHGDGSPTRRYLYAGDAADAFDLVLAKGEVGQVYNVSSDDEISNMGVSRMLLSAYGTKCPDMTAVEEHVNFVRDRPYNDHRYAVDGSKLRALGFRQSHRFEDALGVTVDWYKRFGDEWWGDITPLLSAYPIKRTDAHGDARIESSSGANGYDTPSAYVLRKARGS